MTQPPEGKRHALREPMMWVVLGLPAIVVVASLATVYIAATSGNADAVRDEVTRTAQVQTSELGRDERAAALGLVAVLSVRGEELRLLPVAGRFPADAPLQLVLAHPLNAVEDRVLALEPVAGGWRAQAPLDAGHDWRVEVVAKDGGWRIVGRLKAGERAARLGPALPAR